VKTRLILKPGQRGTKSLVERYGQDLLCVRFRYDAKKRQRFKTVELIVERTAWTPPAPRYSENSTVFLRINAADLQTRQQAKAAGGRWNPEKKLWLVRYGKIAGTPLEKHIQVDALE
jgi:hypothetical protein